MLISCRFTSRFEKEVRAKLNQKANARTSEEQLLLKAFKYFDLNNSGDVCFQEFTKAIEKIGVLTFSEQVTFKFNDISAKIIIRLGIERTLRILRHRL